MKFSNFLKQTRLSMGYKSSRSFYQYLESQTSLGFNYSYYVRIENAKTLPSVKIVHTLASILPDQKSDRLILAFCSDIFPERPHLFSAESFTQSNQASNAETISNLKKQMLSLKQVAILSSTKEHYFIFLLSTLARRPIQLTEVKNLIPKNKLILILEEMEKTKLIVVQDEKFHSISNEMSFPPMDCDKRLENIYKTLDEWDRQFKTFFDFKNYKNKFLLKRISPRYFGLIMSHCDLIAKMIESAEDNQVNLNNEVVVFNLVLDRGNLPG